MPNDERPAIQGLPLPTTEPGVRPLPLSTDAPRTLGLRRIHIVNRGTATFLRHWEVWTGEPGAERLSKARVISRLEWATMSGGVTNVNGVRVLCAGDVLHAPRNARIRRDVPFLLEGLMPDDIAAGGIIVQVHFLDRANRRWSYGGEAIDAAPSPRADPYVA